MPPLLTDGFTAAFATTGFSETTDNPGYSHIRGLAGGIDRERARKSVHARRANRRCGGSFKRGRGALRSARQGIVKLDLARVRNRCGRVGPHRDGELGDLCSRNRGHRRHKPARGRSAVCTALHGRERGVQNRSAHGVIPALRRGGNRSRVSHQRCRDHLF